MATLRELKGRIGSVASSEKITGAMKMISSAKMHKAEQALHRLLPYRTQVESVIKNLLRSDATFISPLLEVRPLQNHAFVVFGSDDGLCGAYNVNISKVLREHIDSHHHQTPNTNIHVICVGNKISKIASKWQSDRITIETIPGIDSKSTGENIKLFLDELCNRFTNLSYDRVDVLYMNFKSVSRQVPTFTTLLPVDTQLFAYDGSEKTINIEPYIFEPNAQSVFISAVPMALLAILQEIFTENRASEQAARIIAMQSANDNAKKLLEQLRLEYNKLRQQSITTELLDILGGQVR